MAGRASTMFGSKARDGAIDAAAKRKRVLEEERVAVFRDEWASRHTPMFGHPRGTNAPAPVVWPDTWHGLAPHGGRPRLPTARPVNFESGPRTTCPGHPRGCQNSTSCDGTCWWRVASGIRRSRFAYALDFKAIHHATLHVPLGIPV
jgi:hypothetical protein